MNKKIKDAVAFILSIIFIFTAIAMLFTIPRIPKRQTPDITIEIPVGQSWHIMYIAPGKFEAHDIEYK